MWLKVQGSKCFRISIIKAYTLMFPVSELPTPNYLINEKTKVYETNETAK